jgi:hypothetical protein
MKPAKRAKGQVGGGGKPAEPRAVTFDGGPSKTQVAKRKQRAAARRLGLPKPTAEAQAAYEMRESLKTKHRVVVWAGGARGIPVTCACGWRRYAKTRAAALRLKREHLA